MNINGFKRGYNYMDGVITMTDLKLVKGHNWRTPTGWLICWFCSMKYATTGYVAFAKKKNHRQRCKLLKMRRFYYVFNILKIRCLWNISLIHSRAMVRSYSIHMYCSMAISQYLVGGNWLPWIWFSHMTWECQKIPIDEIICFRGVALAHQPVYIYIYTIYILCLNYKYIWLLCKRSL